MKRILTIMFIAIFILLGMSISVQATEVLDWENLKTELATDSDEIVTLSSDINGDTEKLTITGTKTLDLNGKTLTFNEQLIVNGGSLTVTGNGKIFTSTISRMIDVYEGSTLILENGTFESIVYDGASVRIYGTDVDTGIKTNVTIGKNAKVIANTPVFISTRGYGVQLNIEGNLKGTAYTNGAYCIYINGSVQGTTGNVPVVNISQTANIIAERGPAVYAAGYGIWNIEGGYFEGTEALSIKAGKFYITGGEFYANGVYVENPGANNNGTESTGSAISITGNQGYAGKIVLQISNAKVTSENGYAVYETITNAVQPAVQEISITSGTYYGGKADVQADNLEKFITGGTYLSGVNNKYLSETVGSLEQENGTVVVRKKHSIIIQETANGTVTASLSEAVANQIVELSVNPADGYKLKGELKVYTIADSEIEVIDGKFVMPDMGVIIVAEFEETSAMMPGGAIQEEDKNEEKVDNKIEDDKIENSIKEEGSKDEKDNTPKTGSINIFQYVWIAVAFTTLVGIAKTKKFSKQK